MGDTDIAWETWGRTDPYFGVVSHRDYRKDQIADHRAAFFAGGKDVILGKIVLCERVFGTLPRNDAPDFGCGVGRLTLPLAEQFETVTGLDISPSMLDEARNNARLMGYLNVTFALSAPSCTPSTPS